MKKLLLITLVSMAIAACKRKHDGHRHAGHDHSGHNHGDHGMEMKTTAHRGYLDSLQAGFITEDTLKGSPTRVAMATVGKSHVHITYQSPGVKGRVIWGGLVPYNTVWVTGAHTATSMLVMHPVEIDGKRIEKGTYAIFTIPGEKSWTFILNKNYKQHLTDDYKQDEDILRMAVTPLGNTYTPRLTYSVEAINDREGEIGMAWDKIKIEVPFKSLEE